MIGDPKFAKPLNYWVLKVKNLKQTLKQDLDSLMARKKGSASTVMLSEEQLKDICGEGSLVCVPRRWLKELGFDPEQKSKARVLGVHPDGNEIWSYRDWEGVKESLDAMSGSMDYSIKRQRKRIEELKEAGRWVEEEPKRPTKKKGRLTEDDERSHDDGLSAYLSAMGKYEFCLGEKRELKKMLSDKEENDRNLSEFD